MDLFIRSEQQQSWLNKLQEKEDKFKNLSAQIDEQGIFPKENIEDLVHLGYTKITLPKEFGGEGLNVYDMVLFQETLASYDSNTALSIGWHLGTVGEIYEKKAWTPENLDFLAKEILNGAVVNRSVSEAQTGSPTRGGRPGTNAVKIENGWVLNGRKTFTTASPILTYFLTSAWVEEKQSIGFFLLHRDLPGLSVDETWNVMSMRGTGSHDLVLDNVRVEDTKLIELPDKKNPAKFGGWSLHIPATYLGIAQAARNYAIHFANHHAPNSLKGPISQLPNVQQHIGEIELELAQARHVLYSVASAYDDTDRRPYLTNEIAIAKHTVINSAIKIVDQAMRVVGAKSLQLTNPLQRYYRDVRAGLHNPPMDDMTIKNLAMTALKEDEK
ncbi:acyl-CoA dehydrogenase family protein [Lederbergia galactosidilytica]|uniref:Acyl-CoA dehydrogenase n=1 Tax=Lederbergia galactosidilytica TaxID=217031 RepID=A0A178A3D6_9BACI|nr:acyl-CoA dehydrogenase family protein [Lederbergia galactosidilytica]OAK74020.1 acyl-CoA dehydrogenase [Lederbergia galactosidilytica]